MGKVKLTDADVVAILTDTATSAAGLACKYGVSASYIWQLQGGSARPLVAPELPRQRKQSRGRTLLDILWSRTVVDEATGCWLWRGAPGRKGYGIIRFQGLNQSVHRRSYSEFKGPIPDELQVLHSCDVPACWNPEHLFLGTNQDNVDDMIAKDRKVRGERSSQAKLSDDAVREIRRDPRPHAHIAAQYGVARSLITRIKSRKSWAHVD